MRALTSTLAQVQPTIPKNINQEYGGNIGGPVYIPRILTGKKKLFFFTNFDRITQRTYGERSRNRSRRADEQRQLLRGGFGRHALRSAAAGSRLAGPGQPHALSESRIPRTPTDICNTSAGPSFTAEYGETGSNVNTIPASRISLAGGIMMQDLAAISKTIATPNSTLLSKVMLNDYQATSTVAYNRNASDTKITYIPSENTQIYGKYGITPYTDSDPQVLGNTPCTGSNACAGGPAADGGQVGNIGGRGQNAGLGFSHVFSPNLVHRRRLRLDSPFDVRAIDARHRGGRLRTQHAEDSGNQRRRPELCWHPGLLPHYVYRPWQQPGRESLRIPR